MQVVRLEAASGGRCFVHMEDGSVFPVGKKDRRNLELEEGKELTEEQIDWIYQELVFPRGRNYLICLLASRDYTIKEVGDKLIKAKYPQVIIDQIISYGLERHYLDDLRYAEDYIHMHKASKSIRQLKYQLTLKGIPSHILAQMEETNSEEELLPLVQRYWDKKKGTPYEKQAKTYQYFVRKGYDSSIIKELIRKISYN